MSRDYKLDLQVLDSQEAALDSAYIEAAELVLSQHSREEAISKVRENFYERQEALSKEEYTEEKGEITFTDDSLNYKAVDNPPQQILAIAKELQDSNGNILE